MSSPPTDLPSLLVYPVDYCFFVIPSTGLLGRRTFLLVFEKKSIFFSDFYLFFVCIHCLIVGSL